MRVKCIVEEYVYNSLDLVSEIWYTNVDTEEDRELAYSYRYSASGELAEIIDHRSNTATGYTYDSAGRLASIINYDVEAIIMARMQTQ